MLFSMRHRRIGSFLLALALLAVSPALSGEAETGEVETREQDAHYLVFTLRGEELRLVSAQRVRLAAPLEPRPAVEMELAEARTGTGDAVTVRLESAAGEILYGDLVEVPRVVRGEFHGRELRPGVHEIEAHQMEPESRSFVVRIPALGTADRLVVSGAGARRNVFELRRLASLERAAPLPAAKIFNAGPVGRPFNRLDLLILGDGYTAEQEGEFTADVRRIADQFFGLSPYADYRSFVNVRGLFTPSDEVGADHPPYRSGCAPGDASCCADPAAQSDPRTGTFVRTAFDSSFCAGGTAQRLLVSNQEKALAAAAAVPDWDRVLMIVNDSEYGGSGGAIPVASLHDKGVGILQHEYGHSFTLLADEYDSPYPGFPACSDQSGRACEANVTDETGRHLIKWAPWIGASTPVPTPEGSAAWDREVGLFQGARYLPSGIYRPRDRQCLMHVLGVPFDEVCRQEYVRQLYRGRWGQPASGIDLVEPGSEVPGPGTVTARTGAATRFAVTLLKPVPGKIEATWLVDGAPVPGATGSSFSFSPPSAGTYRVELKVEDATSFVHPEMAGELLGTSRLWTVKAAGAAGPPCTPAAKRLCIDHQPGDRRFQVEVEYKTPQASGSATAVPLAGLGVDRGGLFWFFAKDNPEMLVKVLDGCGLNQHFWIFYAAGTNAGLTITVTDTATGRSKVYRNKQGEAAPPVQDTSALSCN